MDVSYFNWIKLTLPIAKNGVIWNGRPDEFSNINGGLDYSQEFGLTPYAKTGVYGYLNGEPRIHNGHDFAGSGDLDLVMPLEKGWITHVGWDEKGYGNYVFFETETKTINGDMLKMEFVLAHASKITATPQKWYKRGESLGKMGTTGMSTGQHTHFGGRPLIIKGSTTEWACGDTNSRGYVDLTDFFITKPIYNKQLLINERMEIIKKGNDLYAIDPKGKANLIINWESFKAGVDMGIWSNENIKEVKELPELSQIIILTKNN
jgi:murein DD-endopeptidase MepM/ murein hydrolase activator NlpD